MKKYKVYLQNGECVGVYSAKSDAIKRAVAFGYDTNKRAKLNSVYIHYTLV